MNRQKPPKGIEWTRIRHADGSELPETIQLHSLAELHWVRFEQSV